MYLIVGLGNPGKKYQDNRHNIGFQVVDLLAERHGLSFDIKKGKARACLGTIRLPAMAAGDRSEPGQSSPMPPSHVEHRVLLAKPWAYMNLSGQSVAALARFYQIKTPNILVIYDELDLPVGRIRLRPEGGAGGHNGMRSIMRELGSNGFPRLRIGIGRPPGRMDPADYVLQDFSQEQHQIIYLLRPLAVDSVEHWLSSGIESAMNTFNSQVIE